jgi:exopolysaccharide biosynthesis polyprenyl glycosylphosphotransferase
MSTASENQKAPASAARPAEALRSLLPARLPLVRFLGDATALVVAAALAEVGTRRAGGTSELIWVIVYPVFVLVFLSARSPHSRALRPHVLDELRVIAGRTALAAMIVLSLRALLEVGPQAAGQTARHWVFAAVCVAAVRVVPATWQLTARQAGELGIPTLIVGAGRVGQLVARRLRQYPELGLRPVGFLDDAPLKVSDEDPPVLGGLASFERVVRQHGAEQVIVAFSPASHQAQLAIIRRCHEFGIDVAVVPRLFETMKERVGMEFVGSLPLVSVEPTNARSWQFVLKYAFDRVFAALLLVLIAPLLIAITVAVWASLGRPILFRQRRVGRDGRVFDMLKFRTMNGGHSSDPAELDLPPDTAPGGVEGADRRTDVGRVLRRLSFDELPQLINVLKGEMSLVGPRPERPEFAERFERSIHRYSERHRVKAGITGWAQIHGLRGQTSLVDRAEWDNYYIDNWSVWLDFKILVLTGIAVVRFQAE